MASPFSTSVESNGAGGSSPSTAAVLSGMADFFNRKSAASPAAILGKNAGGIAAAGADAAGRRSSISFISPAGGGGPLPSWMIAGPADGVFLASAGVDPVHTPAMSDMRYGAVARVIAASDAVSASLAAGVAGSMPAVGRAAAASTGGGFSSGELLAALGVAASISSSRWVVGVLFARVVFSFEFIVGTMCSMDLPYYLCIWGVHTSHMLRRAPHIGCRHFPYAYGS